MRDGCCCRNGDIVRDDDVNGMLDSCSLTTGVEWLRVLSSAPTAVVYSRDFSKLLRLNDDFAGSRA
jgi:hypothetical protein